MSGPIPSTATTTWPRADFRSVLSVPMLRDGLPLGTITVYRDVASPFPDRQIELLKTFADQAVIAIENVRLFTELQDEPRPHRALDQQTATSEILRVISSSPTDTQPVFDLLAHARENCATPKSPSSRASTAATPSNWPRSRASSTTASRLSAICIRCACRRGNITARAIRSAKVVHLGDVLADPRVFDQGLRCRGAFPQRPWRARRPRAEGPGAMFVGRERTGCSPTRRSRC